MGISGDSIERGIVCNIEEKGVVEVIVNVNVLRGWSVVGLVMNEREGEVRELLNKWSGKVIDLNVR